jgi:hypothetical protein
MTTAEDFVYRYQCLSLPHTLLRNYCLSQTRDGMNNTEWGQGYSKNAFASAAEELINCIYERFKVATTFLAGRR